jgi:predicted dehydrogenase
MTAPVRWGIIGTGMIANQFATGLQARTDAQLVAVSSRNLATAQQFAHQFKIPHFYNHHTALLSNPEVEVVYIGTPHPTHKQLALDCIHAGKGVLVEKPFTINAQEAQEVIALARAKGVFCMEAMWMRFNPLIQKVKNLVEQQAVGPIRLFHASFGMKAPYEHNNRFFNLALGGGALLDLGVYPINLAFWLLGKPSEVEGFAHLGQTGVDEHAGILLRFEDGRVATLSISNRMNLDNDVILHGETGRLHIHAPLYFPSRMSLQPFAPNNLKNDNPKIRQTFSQVKIIHKLYSRLRRLVLRFRDNSVSIPYEGNGYNYEAAEVGRCLRANKRESEIMPLDTTLQIMETMDFLRKQWGLSYPEERS